MNAWKKNLKLVRRLIPAKYIVSQTIYLQPETWRRTPGNLNRRTRVRLPVTAFQRYTICHPATGVVRLHEIKFEEIPDSIVRLVQLVRTTRNKYLKYVRKLYLHRAYIVWLGVSPWGTGDEFCNLITNRIVRMVAYRKQLLDARHAAFRKTI